MTIVPQTVVSLRYRLSSVELEGENFVEETTAQSPMLFLLGVGQMIPDFEQNLLGKQAGDMFDFEIPHQLAYGEHYAEDIVELPRAVFADAPEGFLTVGNLVPMQNDQGQQLRSLVLAVGEESVRMDFNHPLAGKDLHFVGEILSVRAASADELSHGHAHGVGGHQH